MLNRVLFVESRDEPGFVALDAAGSTAAAADANSAWTLGALRAVVVEWSTGKPPADGVVPATLFLDPGGGRRYFLPVSSIIELKNLSKSYGSLRAVDNVSFRIEEGTCFGLLGPNGAGKTTTIEMMESILKPDSGEILFRGTPIDSRFKERVGIQFQSTALPEYITVRETLELFSSFYPSPRPIEEVAELCSLGDLMKRDNQKLSGGQRQRLLLGIAIVSHPEVVFLDEPTTGLDPQARRHFWELIERIRSENTTVVITTHYMDEAETLCDQIVIMDQGKVLEQDTPASLLDRHFPGALVRVPETDTPKVLPEGASLNAQGLEIVSTNLDDTLKQLLEARVNLEGLTIHKPNLEDLFIKLTGSSLRT